MKITRDFVIQNLADSRLMSADDASSLCESLSSLSGPADSDTVAQELAGTSELTAYQAQCVCRGETSGLLFGDYVVLEKIGQGGMGVVLKAQHTRMERIVAVKKLTAAALESEDLVKRFYREVKASARLLHPNVVTALDAREHEGVHYLIMEFIEGEDLADVLKRQGPLPVDEAVDYVVQAAQGLEFAHKHGVYHRDIKPANLLLDRDGTVKILDMGLARIVSEAKGNEASRDQLTSDDQVMGTCDYMAPEQAENTKGVDHRADIYSLGCTLYRLLTNQPPYTGANLMQLLLAHRESPIPSICAVRPDVPAAVDAVFQKMMAKTRDERYQSMTEVIEALQAALGRGPAPAAAAEPDPGLMDFLKQIHQEPSGVSRGGRGSGKTDAAQAAVTVQEKADPITDETVDVSATADTDPSTSTRQPSTAATRAARQPRPAARRKQKQTPMLLLIGVGIGISLIGAAVVAAVLYVQTNYGTVVVKTDDKDIQVLVKRGGQVHVADAKNQWRVEVNSGKYSVELKEGNDRFVLDKDTITVTRGDEVRVRVELKPRQVASGRGPPPRPAIAPFDETQAKTHQEDWADYLGLPVERDFDLPGGEKLTMVLIPPGEFMMGSTEEELARLAEQAKAAGEQWDIPSNESPQHPVWISRPFYLGKYEVTQAQWEAVMGNNPAKHKNPMRAVGNVSWNEIQPFLSKVNRARKDQGVEFALPTEAQWEYACRAGTTTFWHSGDNEAELKKHAWIKGTWANSVGQFKANAWGLYDMHGSSMEWCLDWYDPDYYRASPMNDPTGPQMGSQGVQRGGINFERARDCRSARRDGKTRWGRRHEHLGFRLACTIPHAPRTKPAIPADSTSQPLVEGPPSKGPDGESPPTGVDAAAPSTASLDDLPPWQLPPDAPKPAIAPFDAGQAKEHQEAWAEYLAAPREVDNSIGMKLVLIPPGESILGGKSQKEGFGGVHPSHRVRLTKAFYVGVYEVTQGEFELLTQRQPSTFSATGKSAQAVAGTDTSRHPVEQIWWRDAAQFCNELSQREGLPAYYRLKDDDREGISHEVLGGSGYRLPTQAEWEFACRAGTTGNLFFGDSQQLVSYAWIPPDADGRTHPVGQKLPNPFGLFDVYGNVWEWCQDWHHSPQAWRPNAIDPQGPVTGSSHPLCGGGLGKEWERGCSSNYHRTFVPPYMWSATKGFRVVRTVEGHQDPAAARHALQFDGQSHVLLPRLDLDTTQPYTIEAVVTPRSQADSPASIVGNQQTAGTGIWIAKWHAVFLRHSAPDGKMYAEPRSDRPLTVGQRIHVAGVFDGKQVRLYIDGKRQAADGAIGPAHVKSELVWYIGADPAEDNSPDRHFCGIIHNVRVSQTARYDADFEPADQFEPDADTVALYQFDEGEGDVLHDSSDNSAHGKIVGANWVQVGQLPTAGRTKPEDATPSQPPPDASAPTTAPDATDSAKPDEQAGAGDETVEDLRTWTDTSGKTVEAALVDVKDGTVRLRIPDGKIAEVPLERLSKQDQAHVSEQAERPAAP